MRLTLRTLLAWLDDTLPPAEVRQIGQNVNESPVANDLVKRINRVTRQRRLAVPPSTGPDGTDPNVVASYLDNELPPDDVAEYEKRCLTSDVHLAEVASVHQILSLIGQKAKVPPEARFRMYRLVKGREAVKPSERARPAEPEPVTQPIEAWVAPVEPRRSWLERVGPVAAVVGLVAVLSWSAWQSIGPAEPPRPAVAVAPEPAATEPKAEVQAIVPAAPNPLAKQAAPAAAAAAAAAAAEEPAEKPAAEAPPPPVPAGSAGLVRSAEGVLLRRDDEGRDWQRLAAEATLQAGDRLVNLTPTRSTLVAGPVVVDLVGPTEATLARPGQGESAHVALSEGRLVLHLAPAEGAAAVDVGAAALALSAAEPVRVGVERRTGGGGERLLIHVAGGEAKLKAGGGAGQAIQGPMSFAVGAGGEVAEAAGETVPSWVTDDAATPYDLEIGSAFAKYLENDRPTLTCLVEAVEDEQPEVRALAIRGLGLLGDVSLVLPELAREGAPDNRRTAVAVLRASLARGGEAADRLREELRFTYGPESSDLIAAMLAGVPAEEAREEGALARLAQHLSHPDLAVRELALDNLKALTGRDDLEYDPEKPEGKGLKAWQDLAAQRRPAAGAPARPR